ncbi:MAG TPA: hypothetical protein VF914_06755, partial [Chloroflexia bacterium]
MKTERHRDRVPRPNTDASGVVPSPNGTDNDPADSADSGTQPNGNAELSAVHGSAPADLGNGYASHDDAEGHANGFADGNGHAPDPESSRVVLTVPRRKRRVVYAPQAPVAPEAVEVPAATVSETIAPAEEQVVAPPTLPGVALPPKAKRKTGPAPAQAQPVPTVVEEEA